MKIAEFDKVRSRIADNKQQDIVGANAKSYECAQIRAYFPCERFANILRSAKMDLSFAIFYLCQNHIRRLSQAQLWLPILQSQSPLIDMTTDDNRNCQFKLLSTNYY